MRHLNIDFDDEEVSDLSDSTTDSLSESEDEEDDPNDDDDDDDDYPFSPDSSSNNTTPRNAPLLGDGNAVNDLNTCVETVRNIIGDIGDAELMRLALAADNDSARAVNFYFDEVQSR